MSDEGPHSEHEGTPCSVTKLARLLAVQGLGAVVDIEHRDADVMGDAIAAAEAACDDVAKQALLESMNEVRLRLDMSAEVLELLYQLAKASPGAGHRYAHRAVERLAGRAATDYLTFFTTTAQAQGLVPDRVVERRRTFLEQHPFGLAKALEERRRWHDDSVHLNSLSWRIAVAVGDVPDGADSVEGDPDEQLTRLIAERDALRAALASGAA